MHLDDAKVSTEAGVEDVVARTTITTMDVASTAAAAAILTN